MNEMRFSENAEIDQYTYNLFDLAKDISRAAKENGKDYFIGGGLSIDLFLGKVTRNHHDIDFHPMLEDYDWWKEYFASKGYNIEEPASEEYPETCQIQDKEGETVVDMWPFRLNGGILEINHNGRYTDASRAWNEVKVVEYDGVQFIVENPERVLDQKKRHFDSGQKFRDQDEHDFNLLGREVDFK